MYIHTRAHTVSGYSNEFSQMQHMNSSGNRALLRSAPEVPFMPGPFAILPWLQAPQCRGAFSSPYLEGIILYVSSWVHTFFF